MSPLMELGNLHSWPVALNHMRGMLTVQNNCTNMQLSTRQAQLRPTHQPQSWLPERYVPGLAATGFNGPSTGCAASGSDFSRARAAASPASPAVPALRLRPLFFPSCSLAALRSDSFCRKSATCACAPEHFMRSLLTGVENSNKHYPWKLALVMQGWRVLCCSAMMYSTMHDKQQLQKCYGCSAQGKSAPVISCLHALALRTSLAEPLSSTACAAANAAPQTGHTPLPTCRPQKRRLLPLWLRRPPRHCQA